MATLPFSRARRVQRILYPFLFLTVLVPGLDVAASPSRNTVADNSVACGPIALSRALSLLGHDANAVECAARAGTDANGVTTMAGLMRAAQSLQVPVCAMHLTPTELISIDVPCILHVSLPGDRDHFVVFRAQKDSRLEISDPSNKIESMLLTPAQLELMWDGHCLVFTERPLRTRFRVSIHRARAVLAGAAGLALGIVGASYVLSRMGKRGHADDNDARYQRTALLRIVGIGAGASVVLLLLYAWTTPQRLKSGRQVLLGADVLDLGEIEWMTSGVTSLWTCNQGQRPVEVYNGKIKSSAAWIRAKASQTNLPPGAKGELKITVRPPRRVGPFEHSVLIPFSGDAGVATIGVRGCVLGPGIAYPPRLYLGRVKPMQSLRRKLLYVARKPDAHVREIRCRSHLVEAHFLSRSAFVTEIEVNLSAPTAEGNLLGTLEIIADDQPKAGVMVPFEGTVVSETAGCSVERTHPAYAWGRLADVEQWSVTTPCALLLADRRVRQAWQKEVPDLTTVLEQAAQSNSSAETGPF